MVIGHATLLSFTQTHAPKKKCTRNMLGLNFNLVIFNKFARVSVLKIKYFVFNYRINTHLRNPILDSLIRI